MTKMWCLSGLKWRLELESKKALTCFEDLNLHPHSPLLLGSCCALHFIIVIIFNRRCYCCVMDPAVPLWNRWRSSHWECPFHCNFKHPGCRRRPGWNRSTPTQYHSEYLSLPIFHFPRTLGGGYWLFLGLRKRRGRMIHGSWFVGSVTGTADPAIPIPHVFGD